ncbi:MAG: Gp49 family protein [Flavobacterium sp.]|uniref:Gp49 family protein n=1 Tax=Flavobacterium sp. TaxID=239 RepID=UPI00261D8422|nr:Gp49 family protein [Flavobacterium sp.]MDD5152018.1 Gp49 family protein [Flavobacterium sp.]
MTEQEIENYITGNKLEAPRLTPEYIDSLIISEDYYHFPGTNIVVCCLLVKNKFGVIGESSCVSDDNFDIELGKKISFENARDKIWMLEGYLLKEKLYENASD